MQLHENPVEQFLVWYQEQAQASLIEASAPGQDPAVNSMVLSTVDAGGAPSSRVLLYKGFVPSQTNAGDQDFIFYSNYESKKARDLTVNDKASLLFFWPSVYRQIRVEGKVLKSTREQSEKYFATRARDSQIGAWASDQSRPIASYQVFQDRFSELEKKFKGKAVPCPPHWGGYVLVPSRFEFWIGKDFRLHERYVYERSKTRWDRSLLSP